MKIFHHIDHYKSEIPSVLTIGTFDGVHIGHQRILEKLKSEARRYELESVLLSFSPHPRTVLKPSVPLKLIDTINEKIRKIESIGINSLILHPFSISFSQLSAIEFMRTILFEKLNVKKLVIGYDHRFGRNREAGVDTLIKYSKKYGFEISVIPAQEISDISISSTKIRKALILGDIRQVNSFLGSAYSIEGTVVKGDAIGRKIGFPTANIEIDEYSKLLPASGVYLVQTNVCDNAKFGMMNIGNRPTINDLNQIRIEVHLFDFHQDIYNQYIRVNVLLRIRDQKKFNRLEDLKDQLIIDQKRCQELIQDQLDLSNVKLQNQNI